MPKVKGEWNRQLLLPSFCADNSGTSQQEATTGCLEIYLLKLAGKRLMPDAESGAQWTKEAGEHLLLAPLMPKPPGRDVSTADFFWTATSEGGTLEEAKAKLRDALQLVLAPARDCGEKASNH